MKKQLLIVLSVLPAYIFAQKTTTVVDPKINVPHEVSPKFIGTDKASSPFQAGSSYTPKLNKHIRYSAILIGKSFYDLQTNSSVGRRIILHDDGKISAVWTTSAASATDWPDRGSGYNHKTASWLTPSNARIETERTGWPCLGVLENAGTKYELIMGHVATTGGWVVSKNNAIGGSFTKLNTSLTQLNNKVAIWGRIGTNNKNIVHLVSNYNGNATTQDPPIVTIKGVESPTTYSRSMDGGNTWDIKFLTLPGYDSSRILAGSADSYAIDVKDSIVAIVTGGLGEDINLYKSVDNGNTFTKIDVEPFQFSPFTQKFISHATPEKTTDGSMDVLIDNNKKVHVFFSRNFVSDTIMDDEGFSFRPGTAQMMHWAEGFTAPILCGSAFDYNGDTILNITGETITALDGNGNIASNDNTLIAGCRYGNGSLVNFPSSAVDANNNLYLVYSAIREDDVSLTSNGNLRDLYVTSSTDDGLTWSRIQNITGTTGIEDVFASVAKRADTYLHLIYQEDNDPGTNLQNNGNTGAHPNFEQRIMYKAIPVADILGGQVLDPISVKRVINDPKIFFVSQNQPNPFSSETNAFIYMRDGSDLTLRVSDIAGKLISNENLGYYSAGNHSITINADGLTSGLYFYTITNNQYSTTQKMQVK